jgi:pilus assembly protein CpaB
VKLVAWPQKAVVPGSFTKTDDVVNRGVISEIQENEPLTDTKLAPVEAGAGLPPTIPQGMRAISVRVNDVIGVAGFVTPGTRVDVFVTLKQGSDNLTRTIVGNVQVLTAGTKYDQDKGKQDPIPSTVVTLLLNPQDAARVVLAANEGQIMLALRNPLDTAAGVNAQARTATLFGEPAPAPPTAPRPAPKPKPVVEAAPPPPPPPAPPKPYMVEAIRAAKRSDETVKTGEVPR